MNSGPAREPRHVARVGQTVGAAHHHGGKGSLGGQRGQQVRGGRRGDDRKVRRGRQCRTLSSVSAAITPPLKPPDRRLAITCLPTSDAAPSTTTESRSEQAGGTEAAGGLVAQQVHGEAAYEVIRGSVEALGANTAVRSKSEQFQLVAVFGSIEPVGCRQNRRLDRHFLEYCDRKDL